ncbi:hypothetical protein BM221_006870 [Beauveria bassiana]|uniref:Uncharacterized protein n=1 Tax=Beauveria bassiana TaxID=176275 RepID=A0A2N6NIV0_BEABA|nr:hypothetical protein BM221_006870 [Beauveria bassiana]
MPEPRRLNDANVQRPGSARFLWRLTQARDTGGQAADRREEAAAVRVRGSRRPYGHAGQSVSDTVKQVSG